MKHSSFNRDIAKAVRIHFLKNRSSLAPIMVPSSFTKFRTKFILWNKSRTIKRSKKQYIQTTQQNSFLKKFSTPHLPNNPLLRVFLHGDLLIKSTTELLTDEPLRFSPSSLVEQPGVGFESTNRGIEELLVPNHKSSLWYLGDCFGACCFALKISLCFGCIPVPLRVESEDIVETQRVKSWRFTNQKKTCEVWRIL